MRVAYDVSLPPDLAAARLSAKIDAPTLLYQIVPGMTAGRRFIGTVSPEAFEVRLRRRSYNSLAPRAKGRIERTAEGCRITTDIGPPSSVRVVLGLLIAVVGISSVPPLLSVGYPPPVAIAVVIVCLLFSTLVLRFPGDDLGFPSREAHDLRNLLEDTFGSVASG